MGVKGGVTHTVVEHLVLADMVRAAKADRS